MMRGHDERECIDKRISVSKRKYAKIMAFSLNLKEGLKGASKGYFPIGFEDLKVENPKLYDIL